MATLEDDDATRVFRAPLVVLALLTLTAGFGDGFSLSRLGVFVANQSGNIVHVGMGIVGQDPLWVLSLISIVGFAAGGCMAWLLIRTGTQHQWSTIRLRLAVGAVLIVIWWAAITLVSSKDVADTTSALVGATTMGVLATALTRIAGVQAQTSYQSGTVLRSAQGLMDWAARSDPVHRSGRTLAAIGTITVLAYAAGGAAGAAAAAHLHAAALLLILVPVGLALVLSLTQPRRP